MTRAVATEFSIPRPEAELLRHKHSEDSVELACDKRHSLNLSDPHDGKATFITHGAACAPQPVICTQGEPFDDREHAPLSEARRLEFAVREPLSNLIEELSRSRQYHETAFPQHPVQRLIFVGGEAANPALCRTIARALSLPAHMGDPLVRMGRTTQVGIESGIDRRQPQPVWAVAIGLSMSASSGEDAGITASSHSRPAASSTV